MSKYDMIYQWHSRTVS